MAMMRCVVWSFNDISQKSASQKSPFVSSKPVYVTSGGIAIRGKAECREFLLGNRNHNRSGGPTRLFFFRALRGSSNRCSKGFLDRARFHAGEHLLVYGGAAMVSLPYSQLGFVANMCRW